MLIELSLEEIKVLGYATLTYHCEINGKLEMHNEGSPLVDYEELRDLAHHLGVNARLTADFLEITRNIEADGFDFDGFDQTKIKDCYDGEIDFTSVGRLRKAQYVEVVSKNANK